MTGRNNMHAEEWRKVSGDSIYSVSTYGRVRNDLSSKIRRASDNGRGYLSLMMGRTSRKYVHRLVAIAFIPNPEGLPEVNHKDGNKKNNQLYNLEWTTRKLNLRHARDELKTIPKGSSHYNAKLSEATVMRARARFLTGESLASIVKDFDVSKPTLCRAIKGRTWKRAALVLEE